tara:strand:- start:12717 stop:13421 length:705 start_codon:yes stop_codon:yes gene_type:complete
VIFFQHGCYGARSHTPFVDGHYLGTLATVIAMAERARIISAYVDHFAARGIEGVLEDDGGEYTRLYEKYGDIDARLQKIWEENARIYCSELGIPWIRPFSSSKFIFLETRLLDALKTQRYTPGQQTKREWLRKKLNECIDAVVRASVWVLQEFDGEDAANAEARKLKAEYEAMISRHHKEQAAWNQRKHENDMRIKEVHEKLRPLRRACREQLSDLGPALFDSSEGRFAQYVSE